MTDLTNLTEDTWFTAKDHNCLMRLRFANIGTVGMDAYEKGSWEDNGTIHVERLFSIDKRYDGLAHMNFGPNDSEAGYLYNGPEDVAIPLLITSNLCDLILLAVGGNTLDEERAPYVEQFGGVKRLASGDHIVIHRSIIDWMNGEEE